MLVTKHVLAERSLLSIPVDSLGGDFIARLSSVLFSQFAAGFHRILLVGAVADDYMRSLVCIHCCVYAVAYRACAHDRYTNRIARCHCLVKLAMVGLFSFCSNHKKNRCASTIVITIARVQSSPNQSACPS